MNYFNTVLTIFLAGLCTAVLVAIRLEAPFIGGAGKQHPLVGMNGELFRLGQSIVTDSTPLTFQRLDTKIALDERTEIIIKNNRDDLELHLIQGRMAINGKSEIIIGETRVLIDGASVVTHYSWLGLIDIVPISGITKRKIHSEEQLIVDAGRYQISSPFEQVIPKDSPFQTSNTFIEQHLLPITTQ